MDRESRGKRNVSTKQAIEMLAENGIQIDEKNAEIVLDFLYFLAKLTVSQYINNNNSEAK